MSKIPVNDAALISAYIQGDSKAFETLLNRSKSKVYTTIYLIVKDRYIAEDLLQETYIKALDVINQGKYNEEENSFLGSSASHTIWRSITSVKRSVIPKLC